MRVRTEAKRAAIVSAAQAAFLEAGFERASMAEIAARAATSKVTLYSYFPSKEALFVEATLEHRRPQFEPAFLALEAPGAELRPALLRFAEAVLQVTCSEDFIAARRTVIGESAHSDIGRLYFEVGPKVGEQRIGAWLGKQIRAGRLRRTDTAVATRQLLALVEAETLYPNLMGVRRGASRAEIRRYAERAVDVFLRAYGKDGGK
jgi:AcrR family transcriptional regulator